MKKLMMIAAVATFATTAQAAPKSKATAKPSRTTNIASMQKAQQKAPQKPAQTKPGTGGTTDTQTSTTGKTSPGPGSPATGSNVLTTEQQPKKAENTFSATFVSEMGVGAAEANVPSVDDKNYKSTNYVGLGYKVSAADKLGIRQYFSANHNAATDKKESSNEVTMMDPAVTWSHKGGKFLGSEPVSTLLYYFAPVSDAAQAINSSGSIRLDASFDYVLTPKWSVGYFLSPRQSFVPTSTSLDEEGKEKRAFSKTSYIHYGYLTHNFTDSIQAYGYGGFIHRWETSVMSLNEEAPIGGIGASFGMFGGVLVLNPELYFEMPTVANGASTGVGGPAIADTNLTYQLVAALTF